MIRKYIQSDIEEILNIWLSASIKSHSFVESSFWESQVKNMRDVYLPASEVYVYENGSTVIGFYAFYDNTIAAIFVTPEFQNQGVGAALITHAKRTFGDLKLTVYKKNEPSCQFYLNHGFHVIQEQTDSHTGQLELLMSTNI